MLGSPRGESELAIMCCRVVYHSGLVVGAERGRVQVSEKCHKRAVSRRMSQGRMMMDIVLATAAVGL